MSTFEEHDYSGRFDFGLWRRLLRYAAPYRKQLIALAAVMVLVALVDALFPMMNRHAVDDFIVPGRTEGLLGFLGLYLAMIVVQALNVYLLIALAGKIEMGLVHDLRRIGFRRLQELSFSYFDRTPVGWIMARMTSDAQRLGDTISWGLVDIVWGACMMVAIAIFMFVMNARLALIVLAVMPPLVGVSLYFQRRILAVNRDVRKTNSRISGEDNEGITGAKTTKTLVQEEANLQEVRKLTGRRRNRSVRMAVYSGLYLPIVLALGSVGTGLALWSGGAAVLAGALTYGTLVAFIGYTVQFFEPVRELARVITELQAAQASAERVMTLIETEPEIRDTPEVEARYGDAFSPRPENWEPLTGAMEFRDVSFRYKEGEQVLEHFNLTVSPGQTIALVGETGGGKSTIVNLACRFYEPTAGEILVDGVDYRTRSILFHQSHLGYVLQQPHLFSGTVKENIRYGRLEASDREVEEAAKMVNAHDFIMRMEAGYDSEVGEGGDLLSTGQKQLVSFARAIIANPTFFVFDEATSSVDTETEQLIQEAVQTVLAGRTSFIIAHRLSTIRGADRILVVDGGRIVEDGTHAELLALGGRYHRLYTSQFLEEERERTLSEQ
ncbi:MAG: ABC transporter ATP-binding protein/permease [Spirochaetales bacterium]|nr:ABC transporter ATP-binding protein/permease [Spirochaetales bacterium]